MRTFTLLMSVLSLSALTCLTAGAKTAAAKQAPAKEAAAKEAPVKPAVAPQVLTLAVSGSATVTLDGNPSTGYQWVDVDGAKKAKRIVDVKMEVEAPKVDEGKAPVCGAPAPTKVKITGLEVGHYTLKLVYIRPWEKDAKPAQEASIDITVYSME